MNISIFNYQHSFWSAWPVSPPGTGSKRKQQIEMHRDSFNSTLLFLSVLILAVISATVGVFTNRNRGNQIFIFRQLLNSRLLFLSVLILAVIHPFKGFGQNAAVKQPGGSLKLQAASKVQRRNIIFILTDDHRYDALGFLKAQTFIKTPNLDRLATGGAYLPNAFVTTSLCSPSRASILTGLYAHKHKVVDNQNPVSSDLVFFPQYLEQIGYQTAMVGKWHMGGDHDEPQRGFDYWVSFKGQGSYLPEKNGFNVNGRHIAQKGYITDELTDYALDFLKTRAKNKPFMLYLSHKGVHADFIPADRDKGMFKDDTFKPPLTMEAGHHFGAPMWLQNQRNSWHGVEYPYHSNLDIGGSHFSLLPRADKAGDGCKRGSSQY